MFGYQGYPIFYGMPPQQGPPQHDWVNDLIKELKALKKMRKTAGRKERIKKDEPEFIKIPVRKPKTFSTVQMMMILTALFPVIGPLYYLGVVSSWALLKAGMMAVLGN